MPKIAVAIIHGVGKQDPNFADDMMDELRSLFVKATNGEAADSELVMKPIYWAPAIQNEEDQLWGRLKDGGDLGYMKLRQFMVDFAGDAIAYQPTPNDRQIYDKVHGIFADTLHDLSDEAGDRAPLCIISHSLGTVITCNYFYDLHQEFHADTKKSFIGKHVLPKIGATPLERGETLTLFYTMGSPIAVWSLRYNNPLFGAPIKVPSPLLSNHYPSLKGEWVNYYDEDDVIGYPLKTLNEAYNLAVKEDRQVNVGGILTSWTPLSHTEYWTDSDVTKPIAAALADMWRNLK